MRLCALDTIHHGAFNKLPNGLHCTLPSKLSRCSQVHTEYAPSTLPSTFSSTLPSMLSRTLLTALDGTLPICLTVRSRVSSQDALKTLSRRSQDALKTL